MIDWLSDFPIGIPLESSLSIVQLHTATRLAIDQVNNKTFPDLLLNTEIALDIAIVGFSTSKAISDMINFAEQGHTLAIGFPTSDIAKATATVGTVYGVSQIGTIASASDLSNELAYPYFSRLAPSPKGYTETVKSALLYYESIRGAGWTEVGVISTTTEFTNNLANTFVSIADPEITILTYQQFLLEEFNNLEIEFRELQNSGARVFYAAIFDKWPEFLEIADSYGLVGDHYVWIAPPAIALTTFSDPSPRLQGSLGAITEFREPDTPEVEWITEIWNQLDPKIYPGSEYPITNPFVYIGYDVGITAALAIDRVEKMGKLNDSTPPELWNEAIRSVQFEGISNYISFESNGDIFANFNLQYYSSETNKWSVAGKWSQEDGYEPVADVVWHSNTTIIPDLDIREPFNYWSCHNKEMRTDKTGKMISLRTPDASDIDNIDSDYHCDYFIDCKNLSDESFDCKSNYTVIFIVFGVITGLLVLVCLLLIVFVFIFGVILKYRRLRSASPIFLILIALSVLVGYVSIYAWFGKPHPVSCAVQPWILGLPTISMIAALCVKNFRIYRIFKFPMKMMRISNFELFILWVFVMAPAITILTIWTIVSTPTATMKDLDGNEHYVCETGGFTGPPGGLIFFFVLVSYTGIVLLIGAVISFLIRNVPSRFNESKIITISIYNLILLGCVIIPVYLVIIPFNPFVAWILRTVAVLYAFSAALLLLFCPLLFGILIVDKGKNIKVFNSSLKGPSSTPNPNRTSSQFSG